MKYAAAFEGEPLVRNITSLEDALILVHGTFDIAEGGYVYTSEHGANISSTNEDAGKIQFNTKVTGSKALYKVCFAIGASEANNSWSDMIYGGQTTAYPAHLTNGDGTYVQSSGTEAGKQYVPISTVIGRRKIPVAAAKTISKAIAKVQGENNIKDVELWRAVEILAEKYLAGD